MAGTTRKKAVALDPNELIEVSNGSPGVLVYVNKQTGATVTWTEYGDVQMLTVQELMNIRSQQPKFFQNQWMIVSDEDVISYLRLGEFYKDLITQTELDQFFDKSPEEIREFLAKASKGAKLLIAGRAKKLYEDEKLTDVHKIRAINSMLGTTIGDVE